MNPKRTRAAEDAPPEDAPPEDAPPGLLAALAERGAAELSRATLVAETALVESRLAASSLLLLLLAVLCASVLLVVSWVLLMALVAVGLAVLGLGAAGGLGIVLGAHLLALLALALFARSLAKNLRFGHTLRALGRDPETLAAKARRAAEAGADEVTDGAAHAAADSLDAPPPPRR